jgi:hypothetical protein
MNDLNPLAIVDGKPFYHGDTLPAPRTIETPTRRAALEEHIAEYIAEVPGRAYLDAVGIPNGLVIRDAIEHGWHGATADIAERLDAIVAEARAEVAKRMPYPILKKLDELTDALKKSVGA